ncbi:hypothetical protein HBI81_158460 [Parastagonospora nodorum]|nr:hypothetical protein HBH51_225920 [Parastagonospora nodorum]KAH3966119.1 hypothetical protein HBH52_201010 [Parastagonospora nodorum]KAH4002294.1 hypothetical protein HBI10_075930 [Parastagonospora nodorum]KAH4025938.1 hypothetical protein HBI13_071740 [Parastagonospora nodorum]KAH4062514.1 hypothetical protein HBH50_204250 [Parastagonospora nodorum]
MHSPGGIRLERIANLGTWTKQVESSPLPVAEISGEDIWRRPSVAVYFKRCQAWKQQVSISQLSKGKPVVNPSFK